MSAQVLTPQPIPTTASYLVAPVDDSKIKLPSINSLLSTSQQQQQAQAQAQYQYQQQQQASHSKSSSISTQYDMNTVHVPDQSSAMLTSNGSPAQTYYNFQGVPTAPSSSTSSSYTQQPSQPPQLTYNSGATSPALSSNSSTSRSIDPYHIPSNSYFPQTKYPTPEQQQPASQSQQYNPYIQPNSPSSSSSPNLLAAPQTFQQPLPDITSPSAGNTVNSVYYPNSQHAHQQHSQPPHPHQSQQSATQPQYNTVPAYTYTQPFQQYPPAHFPPTPPMGFSLSSMVPHAQSIPSNPYGPASSYFDPKFGVMPPGCIPNGQLPGSILSQVHGVPMITSRAVKPKRKRATPEQTNRLNEVFAETFFPTSNQRMDLAMELGMSPRTVQIWFQNKRQGWRSEHRRPVPREPVPLNTDFLREQHEKNEIKEEDIKMDRSEMDTDHLVNMKSLPPMSHYSEVSYNGH